MLALSGLSFRDFGGSLAVDQAPRPAPERFCFQARCWSEDRSASYPLIHTRAIMRSPSDPRHFAGGSWPWHSGEERAATRASSSEMDILLGFEATPADPRYGALR